MYRPALDPVSGHPAWSALLAALPVLTLFALLGGLRVKAWIAPLGSLAVTLLTAVLAYAMPAGQALSAAGQGAAFGLFPLAWTFTTAIWIYTMTVASGPFEILRRAFARTSDDRRIQALIIAFCFGSLLEALAGQGTPVAITSLMLLTAGFSPVRAATLALVGDTVPAAFGPLGLPITTLSKVSDLPVAHLGAMAGRQVPLLAPLIPALLVAMVDGRRGLREAWLPAAACGLTYALAQFATANYLSVPLADVTAALASACAVIAAARPRPATAHDTPPPAHTPHENSTPTPIAPQQPATRAQVWRAYSPYLVIIAIFATSQVHPVSVLLEKTTVSFRRPGLHLLTASGKRSTLPVYKLNWLSSPGTLLLAAGLITMLVLPVPPRAAASAYIHSLTQLRWAVLTVTGLLALSFVMNAAGQTATLATWMADAAKAFALLSPILGWLGVAVTGSDTSSNSLFGALQVTAAHRAGLNPTLLAAANASGGVVGKMISLQNLTISAGAVGLSGREGHLLRRMFALSMLLLAVMCLIVGLQATSVLNWMIP